MAAASQTLPLADAMQLVVTTMKEVQAKQEEAKRSTLTLKELDAQLEARAEFLKLGTSMSLQQQCEELKKHANTPMSYAEMRARFG